MIFVKTVMVYEHLFHSITVKVCPLPEHFYLLYIHAIPTVIMREKKMLDKNVLERYICTGT